MKQSPEQINKKILQLNVWLINNPKHKDYTTVLKDTNNLKLQLIKNTKK